MYLAAYSASSAIPVSLRQQIRECLSRGAITGIGALTNAGC